MIKFSTKPTIAAEGLQNVGLCSALSVFKQGGIFIVPHLLWHGTLIFPVLSKWPMWLWRDRHYNYTCTAKVCLVTCLCIFANKSLLIPNLNLLWFTSHSEKHINFIHVHTFGKEMHWFDVYMVYGNCRVWSQWYIQTTSADSGSFLYTASSLGCIYGDWYLVAPIRFLMQSSNHFPG
jgi:hypothetical protein